MRIKIYITAFIIINMAFTQLKAEKTINFSDELYEIDPITAFVSHPEAEQKIKETIELKLDLSATQQNPQELAKAWDAFNHQKQSEYLSQLGFPNSN